MSMNVFSEIDPGTGWPESSKIGSILPGLYIIKMQAIINMNAKSVVSSTTNMRFITWFFILNGTLCNGFPRQSSVAYKHQILHNYREKLQHSHISLVAVGGTFLRVQ